jgi:hypothetical protein
VVSWRVDSIAKEKGLEIASLRARRGPRSGGEAGKIPGLARQAKDQ